MHHARLEKSARLQRVKAVLSRHKHPLTTMDIIEKAEVCAVNSIISELRENGMKIKCWRSGPAWYYQMER
jgi:hypothetical protein